MRFIGIDYGSKKTGIARSDDTGTLAFPYQVIKGEEEVLSCIASLIEKESYTGIVIGSSYNSQGVANKIQESILLFKKKLEVYGLPVYLQLESFTSQEARRYHPGGLVDAQAAALILQRFLETQ